MAATKRTTTRKAEKPKQLSSVDAAMQVLRRAGAQLATCVQRRSRSTNYVLSGLLTGGNPGKRMVGRRSPGVICRATALSQPSSDSSR